MYTLSLEIINKCNLNCTYCYLGEKKNTYMSLETAQKVIDIAVHEANKQHDRTLMVYFIGEDQEDTMCKECQYIRHCKTRGCQVANYEIHQNVYQPIKVNCEMTKWMYHLIQTNLTEKQLEKLKQEYERRYLRHGK